jgi:flagellar biosynthesis protein FliR
MSTTIVIYIALVLTRVGVFVMVMPLFAGRVPRTVRVALAVVLTCFYLGQIAPGWDKQLAGQGEDIHWLPASLAIVREIIIGGLLGFAFSLFMLPARIAGEFVTQQIGLAQSNIAGLSADTPAGPITVTMESIFSLVFLMLDGHHIVLTALHVSFMKLPLGGTIIPDWTLPAIGMLQHSYETGLLLAGPLGLCLFILTIVLALMNRMVSQLGLTSIGYTLQVMVASGGMLLFLPDTLNMMARITAKTGTLISQLME